MIYFEVGKRKNEVAAEIYHTGIWGGEDEDGLFGGDYAAICPLLPTNKEATAAHLTWNDKIIPNNSGLFLKLQEFIGIIMFLCHVQFGWVNPLEIFHTQKK